MNKEHLTKTAVSVLAASLAFGGTAWAEQAKSGTTPVQTTASTTFKSRFPDVPTSHWGLKYITKLGLTGIIVGNEKGQFEPESPVTQEQVIVLAIRLAGLEKEALQINASSYALPSSLEVSPYAKPYIIEAIEKQLIDPAEEATIASQSKATGKWGTRSASREWVAKLVVRSIGKADEAKAQESKQTSFKDNADLSTWARGYVNEAVSLKIVDGMGDGSFKPKDTVTRGQIAAFLSRADRYSESLPEAVSVGTVKSVSASALTITDDLGDDQTFSLVSDTVYYGTKSETAQLKASDLKQNNQVYVIHNENKASYVEVLKDISDTPVLDDTIEGVFISADAETSKLSIVLNGKKTVVDLAVPLTILDQDGKGASLSSLEAGSRLELQRTGGTKYTSITVKQVPVKKTAEGILKAVKPNEKRLSVNEKDIGNTEYPLADNVLVTLNNGISGELSELRTGDSIRYQVINSQVTSITVLVPYTEPEDSGELINLSTNRNLSYMTIKKDDGTVVSYSLPTVVPVEISGINLAGLGDIVVGDHIKVTLDDSKKKVTSIKVTSRSIKTSYFDTVNSYDKATKTLTVKNVSGSLKVYQLSDDTEIYEEDDDTIPISSADTYLVKGKKVDITASQDTDARMVRFSSSYTGTITWVNSAANELTLNIGENQSLTFKLTDRTGVILAGSPSADIKNLSAGDRVKIELSKSQDYADDIIVQKTVTYRLISKDTNRSELRLKDESGKESLFSVESSLPILGAGKNELSIEDLPEDENISIAYSGFSSDKIVLLNTIRGKITNIDSSAEKITIADFNGNTQVLDVSAGAKLKTAAGTNGFLSDLKLDDRVEAYQNEKGLYTVTVAQALERPVSSFNPYDKTLYVQRPSLQDQDSYLLHPKVYVHQGSTGLNPNFLVANDQTRIYVIYGKIIELEKL